MSSFVIENKIFSTKKFNFSYLPLEIQNYILLYCDYNTLICYSKTSKSIYKEIRDNNWFWKIKTKRDFGFMIPKNLYSFTQDWKFLYIKYRQELSLKLLNNIKSYLYSDNSKKKVLEILNSDIDTNIRDKFGDTPLIIACKYKDIRIVRKLLNMRADPNIKNHHNVTALMEASRGGMDKPEIIHLLLEHGSKCEHKDQLGRTPLNHAIQWNHNKTIQELLKVSYDLSR